MPFSTKCTAAAHRPCIFPEAWVFLARAEPAGDGLWGGGYYFSGLAGAEAFGSRPDPSDAATLKM